MEARSSEIRVPCNDNSNFTILPLVHGKQRVYINLPQPLLPEADFCWQQREPTPEDEKASSEMEVFGLFMQTIFTLKPNEQIHETSRKALLRSAILQFHRKYVAGNDIHAVTRNLPCQETLIRVYNNVRWELLQDEPQLEQELCPTTEPALIRAAKNKEAGVYIQFGGQATSYFDRLQQIYADYPEARNYIESAAQVLKEEAASSEARMLGYHKHGLDVLQWLKNPQQLPPKQYLSSAPVSYPMILLTQTAEYVSVGVENMAGIARGASGHSQGIVAAVLAASATTKAAYATLAMKLIRWMFWQGTRMHQVFHQRHNTELSPDLVKESLDNGDGIPTPMMAVTNVTVELVERVLNQVKKSQKGLKVELSLINGPRAVVLAGHPKELHFTRLAMRKQQAKEGEDQSKMVYSARKAELWTQYLDVTAPFHSQYTSAAIPLIMDDLQRLRLMDAFKPQSFAFPVHSTFDGSDLSQSKDLALDLVTLQCVKPVNWPKALKAATHEQGITHIIDFGPSQVSSKMTARFKEGTGVQVIDAGSLQLKSDGLIVDRTVLLDRSPSSVTYAMDWAQEFAPKLIATSDGSLMVDTKFTRLLGKPPVMVAGMTPTTANDSIVAAFTNAGFHGELAAGGLPREKIMRDTIQALMDKLNPGEGITLNMLFLNPKLWGFQFPLIGVLRQEGVPIDSITIAAGIPSLEKSNEIISELKSHGIHYISFKPGNIDAIKAVVEIAKANPEMKIVIQWTGGRGGGHHSPEDFYHPILVTYAMMRRQPNVVLVGGSGIGEPKQAVELLRGTWSSHFNYPPMPFDAVLLGSRVMVAKEALTAPEVKELLVKTPGVEHEKEWVKTYEGEVGGIVSVISELGEPIHKVATRGVKLWHEFDKKFFSLPSAQAEKAILEHKAHIIKGLNECFQKPYFGRKSDGKVVDLPEMTYAEVLERMVQLMYVTKGNQSSWIHPSYEERTRQFMQRAEQRLGNNTGTPFVTYDTLEADPHSALKAFFERYPAAVTQLLASEDVDYFYQLCKQRSKPVNFVPVIDRELSFWFKKDSLWQSENLDAVPGRDVERVCVLQGPVSVKYSTKADEPIGDILNGINRGIIDDLLKDYPDKARIPYVEYFGGPAIKTVTKANLSLPIDITENHHEDAVTTVIQLPSDISNLSHDQWLEFLAGGSYSWWRALITSPFFVRRKQKVDNPVARLFAPRPRERIEIVHGKNNGEVQHVRVFSPMTISGGTTNNTVPSLEVKKTGAAITVTISHYKPPDQFVPLALQYVYKPRQGYAPIHALASRNDLIKEFYAKLWFGHVPQFEKWSITDQFTTKRVLTRHDINQFCTSIGSRTSLVTDTDGAQKMEAPVDFAIVACWEPLVQTLFPKEIDTDLFKLLHLSYGYKLLESVPLREGDTITSRVEITEVVNLKNPAGKRVTVKGDLIKDDKVFMEVNSQFLFRGTFNDFQNTFRKTKTNRKVDLKDNKSIAILLSKPWLVLDEGAEVRLGDCIVFNIETHEKFADEKRLSEVNVKGTLSRLCNGTTLTKKIGTISFTASDVLGDPVSSYLARQGQPVEPVKLFENGGYPMMNSDESEQILAPKENYSYSIASGDMNPIHTNRYLADLAGLPNTITHGMWTAALARRVIEKYAVKGDQQQGIQSVKSYNAQFLDMVEPLDELQASVYHVGMKNGRKMIEVKINNSRGATVLKGTAEVEQPITAFVFTGQGSAEQNMGMDLYTSSLVAKDLWDKADKHLMAKFGFSILDIVRKNPKQLVVHFGGPKGAAIRENYMALKSEITVNTPNGRETRVVPLFPGIKPHTESYTFQHPQGLLYATQFTQPALTLVEKSAFEDMRTVGLVPNGTHGTIKVPMFAGHSLGEYAALSSIANILSVEALVELVFIRGITMQTAVERDEKGRSSFAMVAVNPTRVGSFFTQQSMHKLVDEIALQSQRLIEVVNYNVENTQYIVTGHLSTLKAMSWVLDEVHKTPQKLQEMNQLVTVAITKFGNVQYEPLEKGIAAIPLPGIDVPFHSKYLLGGVPRFREYLMQKLKVENLDPNLLEGRYIPNLTAAPFALTKDYAQYIYGLTNSTIIKNDVLSKWEEIVADRQLLGYKLLVELLAYQFASPVRWIETVDYFFTKGVERLIEVGPNSTLTTMAKRTLASGKYPVFPGKELLAFCSDKDAIYYDNVAAPAEQKPAAKAPAPKVEAVVQPTPTTQVTAPAPAPATTPVPSGAPVQDAPVPPFDVIQTLIALKLNKGLNDIKSENTIKELVGGKSALQNEMLGDLQKEFGVEPEGAAELPLSQLSVQLGPTYQKLGPHTNKMVAKLISTKMPGGFGMPQIKSYLNGDHRLGDGRIEGVLLLGMIMAPADRLPNESKAKEWLDGVVKQYASSKGIALGQGASAATGGVTAVVDSAALLAYQQQHQGLIKRLVGLYSNYLGEVDKSTDLLEAEAQLRKSLESELTLLSREQGKEYIEGIIPLFDIRKERKYDSWWNWVREEAVTLARDALNMPPDQRFGPEHCLRALSLLNRSSSALLPLIKNLAKQAEAEGNMRVANHINNLAESMTQLLDEPPVFRILNYKSAAPRVTVQEDGRIVYEEVPRPNVESFLAFIQELKAGHVVEQTTEVKHKRKLVHKKSTKPKAPTTKGKTMPYAWISMGKPEQRKPFDNKLTRKYYNSLMELADKGVTFHKRVVLVTGCGKGSIGMEVVKGLLSGGATIIATTSRFSPASESLFRQLYQLHGAKDSQLILYPFNQGSLQDVKSLVSHIYDKEKGLGLDLDYIIPFAAISETGRDISNVDSVSELAHRVMLTNLVRMLGFVKSNKQNSGIDTKPTHVMLPLSPNHGLFGFDGLYSESKLGLETLFNRWESEGWSNFLSLTGAVIGWTRGTGLMAGNNIVAQGVEELGARTFSQAEMSALLLGLLHPEMVVIAQQKPLWADLGGGMASIKDLKNVVDTLRANIMEISSTRSAVAADAKLDMELTIPQAKRRKQEPPKPVVPKANFKFNFPPIPPTQKLDSLSTLRGMVDLERTVVIVGMGEVGPWGNTRTRWEMEHAGEFSMEGCIELAWIMGLIKYFNGNLKDGQSYCGWVDAKSGDPVPDTDVKPKYEETILKHCGIREIEPELFDGYNPHKKMFLHEVALNHDMPPFEVGSEEEALQFKLQHGEKATIRETSDGVWQVQLHAGAVVTVSRALRFDRFVAGQIPTGWDPIRYGVPADIVNQVDKLTLFNLVSTVEALVSAGVTDPYEFYHYVHVSQVGNTSGGGLGGIRSIRGAFRERLLEKNVQGDILQELFINTMPAWVNMLILSSSGPIKTPVGACATAAQSVELGVETIRSGKAKVVVVGGYDDFGEEGSYEFGQMKATSNNQKEVEMGRQPKEMCRPATSTRGGFMEAQGAGTQVLASADLALAMGLPIYGVVALTNTATDKEGRSVPAPGQGIMTTARQAPSNSPSPLLDINYRRKQLAKEKRMIDLWKQGEIEELEAEVKTAGANSDSSEWNEKLEVIKQQAQKKLQAAYTVWGNDFYIGNDHIAPLNGALSVWGLTIDDVGVVSFHGTGTKANDYNESDVTQAQLEHLGRTKGKPVLSVFQKWMTGHPKGAAAAWMLNGLVQCMLTGNVPGNKNADNIDPALRKFDHIIYPTKTIQTSIKAALLKSFGFGQASAEILLVHPDYLLATIEPDVLQQYLEKRNAREQKHYVYNHNVLSGKTTLVHVKTSPPYEAHDQKRVYLDPTARAVFNPKTQTWAFVAPSNPNKHVVAPLPETPQNVPPTMPAEISPRAHTTAAPSPHVSASKRLEVTLREAAEGLKHHQSQGIGVDVEDLANIDLENSTFIDRNFTETERAYCMSGSNPEEIRSRFCGRWAAKEAVIKAISSVGGGAGRNMWSGAGASLKTIEISPSPAGPPTVVLHGHPREVAAVLGVTTVSVSISHSGNIAVAQAVADVVSP